MKTIALLCLAALTSVTLAQAPKAPVKKERKPSPAFAKIEDEPGLPRVLIIGDSISIGYTLDVRALLKGKANVHRIPTNGGPTTNGLKNIQAWLGDGKWDVIHFNWGLHDLKYIQDDPSKRADPKAPGSHQQVALADYEKNLAASPSSTCCARVRPPARSSSGATPRTSPRAVMAVSKVTKASTTRPPPV